MTDHLPEWQMNAVTGRFRSSREHQLELLGIVGELGAAAGRLQPTPAVVDSDVERSADLLNPFGEILALAGPADEEPKRVPPPSRYMVRVATIEPPHRMTKRNYNYFKDLDDALAARADGEERARLTP